MSSRIRFLIAGVGDADKGQAQTIIQARPEAHQAATDVASALGVPDSRVAEVGNLPSADVRVILGADAQH